MIDILIFGIQEQVVDYFWQGVRCKCGRWADSDSHGQCWVCSSSATYPGQPLAHHITGLLFAAIEAIEHAWKSDR